MTDKSQTEQLFDKVRQGELITLEQPFNFSCRGCGFMCCYNMEISLTPPEYAVILWYLARSPLGKVIQESNIKWADMSLGETTGLPIAGITLNRQRIRAPATAPSYSRSQLRRHKVRDDSIRLGAACAMPDRARAVFTRWAGC